MILFDPKKRNLGIWARNPKNENYWKIANFPNFKTLGCFWSFHNFFWVVLAGLGSNFLP